MILSCCVRGRSKVNTWQGTFDVTQRDAMTDVKVAVTRVADVGRHVMWPPLTLTSSDTSSSHKVWRKTRVMSRHNFSPPKPTPLPLLWPSMRPAKRGKKRKMDALIGGDNSTAHDSSPSTAKTPCLSQGTLLTQTMSHASLFTTTK